MVTPTQMTITPLFDGNKQMTVQGYASVNEYVSVTVVGVASIVADKLVLRFTSPSGRVEYARFPAETGETWAVSGDDVTCTLKLNTPALQLVFRNRCADEVEGAVVLLENGTTNNLYAKGGTVIGNWIQNPLDPVAGSAQMQAQIDVIAGRVAEHQHDGSEDSAQFPHNNLTERDAAGAHPAIEAGVANAALAAVTAQNAAEVAASNASTALGLAQQAVVVTAMIQDGEELGLVTGSSTLGQVKTLLNQVVILLNTWRRVS